MGVASRRFRQPIGRVSASRQRSRTSPCRKGRSGGLGSRRKGALYLRQAACRAQKRRLAELLKWPSGGTVPRKMADQAVSSADGLAALRMRRPKSRRNHRSGPRRIRCTRAARMAPAIGGDLASGRVRRRISCGSSRWAAMELNGRVHGIDLALLSNSAHAKPVPGPTHSSAVAAVECEVDRRCDRRVA